LLKFRPRSVEEMRGRLKKKGFSSDIIKDTISFLKEKEFLDDRNFASGWVENRLKRPFGLRRIKQELKAKGIDKELIEQQLQQTSQNYFEQKIVEKLARDKWARLKNIDPRKAKTRIYGYLARRGFSPDAIIDILNHL